MSYKDCKQYSTLVPLKKRMEELKKEHMELLRTGPHSLRDSMNEGRVLRQMEDVASMIIAGQRFHCMYCHDVSCPYYMEAAKFRLRESNVW